MMKMKNIKPLVLAPRSTLALVWGGVAGRMSYEEFEAWSGTRTAVSKRPKGRVA